MRTIGDLAASILKHAPASGMAATNVPGLWVIREDRPTVPVPSVYEASLCLIAQGAKRVSLGDHSVVYDPSRYLLVSVDLPLVGHVIDASPDAPYLCCKIDLDMAALADLMIAEGVSAPKSDLPVLAVHPCEPDLVDAVCRLAALLDRPESVAALAPLIQREVLHRLLHGPHGPLLRQMSASDSHLSQISRAIATIRQGFQQRLRIDAIAEAAGMSASSLHAHFKAITRMTPLAYQKHLRLQEARRLMLAEGSPAGDAGFAVGYESQSQFTREYRRLFGAPPRQDIERLHRADIPLEAV
jgi:AraC-like DNA-binding protein